MIETILLGGFSVLFAYLARYKYTKWGLKTSFFLIFSFLALRFNFGNDYSGYLYDFSIINSSSIFDYYELRNFRIELGWIILCKIFKPLGFFALVAFLALFNSIVYYRFIKKYVPIKYYWFAVFLYIFSPYIMLVQLSAMRQSIAISLFILSINFIINKKILLYISIIVLASFFHTSALILLPVYFLRFIKWEAKNITISAIILLFLILILAQNFLQENILRFITSFFIQYEGYLNTQQARMGLMVPFTIFIIIIVLKLVRYQKIESRTLFMIATISFLLLPISIVFPMANRIVFYFQIAILAVFPLIIFTLKNPVLKLSLAGIITIFTLYMFYSFFQSETWIDSYSTYQTIFTAGKLY